MVFAQESIKRMFEDHGEKTLAEGAGKKGTLIFTGTLGALRCNAEFASYGASRGSVRQLAQALAKELSAKGIHVAVCIPEVLFRVLVFPSARCRRCRLGLRQAAARSHKAFSLFAVDEDADNEPANHQSSTKRIMIMRMNE